MGLDAISNVVRLCLTYFVHTEILGMLWIVFLQVLKLGITAVTRKTAKFSARVQPFGCFKMRVKWRFNKVGVTLTSVDQAHGSSWIPRGNLGRSCHALFLETQKALTWAHVYEIGAVEAHQSK